MLEVSALNPGQPTPKAMPSSTNAATKAGTVVANARTTQPMIWATVPQMTTTRAPRRSISAPTGPVTTRATTAIRPISRPGDVERDAAHLVHVDDRERQGHAPADAWRSPSSTAATGPGVGSCVPETAQGQPVAWRAVGGLAGRAPVRLSVVSDTAPTVP